MTMSDDLNGALADLERAETEIDTLRAALLESLILQSHYAVILNRFDAGERMTFPTVATWLERLHLIGKLP
ncbi:MAG TPA: hypothetical protein VNZ53_22185 [Steroidobacteraceae bacterium]|nr:hypothetical protein [Steroidobacteraceae bacterium]